MESLELKDLINDLQEVKKKISHKSDIAFYNTRILEAKLRITMGESAVVGDDREDVLNHMNEMIEARDELSRILHHIIELEIAVEQFKHVK
jgi:catechol-2,3-dioxygenase